MFIIIFLQNVLSVCFVPVVTCYKPPFKTVAMDDDGGWFTNSLKCQVWQVLRGPSLFSPPVIQKGSDNDCIGSLSCAQWAVAYLAIWIAVNSGLTILALINFCEPITKAGKGQLSKTVLKINTAFEIVLFWLRDEPATSKWTMVHHRLPHYQGKVAYALRGHWWWCTHIVHFTGDPPEFYHLSNQLIWRGSKNNSVLRMSHSRPPKRSDWNQDISDLIL